MENGGFNDDKWITVSKGSLWLASGNINLYSFPNWITNNSPYADAPSNEYMVRWKWTSLVEPDNGMVRISTKGFATKGLKWSDVGVTYVNKIEDSFNSNPIIGNGEFKTDFLEFNARPSSISFDYKYISYPISSDNCIIYVKLYDSQKNEISNIGSILGNDQDQIGNISFIFNFSDIYTLSKAKYISLYFKSGSKIGNSAARYIQGAYDASPHALSEFIGSQLWIDNIKLIY